MKTFKRLTGKIGLVSGAALFGALVGCTTYVEQPRQREVYVEPPPVYVAPAPVYARPAPVRVVAPVISVGLVIRTEDDFYEPLSEYGRWEIVVGHGRCWIPSRVDRDWRPYCNGNWERTEAGWYWQSDEPWGWATYHYGRWDYADDYGWYWVPQTVWAPAWVSWHEGGGYVGWAPLQPSARFSSGGSVTVNVALIAPRAFVFVEPRRFLQPVRPTTVVVNNTTIINNTINITNVKIVNNTVINEGPRTQIIEQASGESVRAVPVRELRRKQEAEVVSHQQARSPGRGKKENNVPAPSRTEAEQPRDAKVQSNGQRGARETDAAVLEQSQRNSAEASRAAQAESQRQANDARLKAREDARTKVREDSRLKAQADAEAQVLQRSQALEKKSQADAQKAAKESEAAAQMESQRSARELKRAEQAEAQRQANEARVKAQADAQTKAKEESEAKAQLKVQQRSQELEMRKQQADQAAARDTERKTRLESERSAREAAAQARVDAQIKAREAAPTAQMELPPRGKNSQPNQRGNRGVRGQRGQIENGQGETNSVNTSPPKRGQDN